MDDFFKLHDKFMKDKLLEGLAERTLHNHRRHMRVFEDYFRVSAIESGGSRKETISVRIFKDYIYHMHVDMSYKPCTINIRLRTLKCYLNWLYLHQHVDVNISQHLKLVKVPIDTIQPLTKKEVKAMMRQCDTRFYHGYRDYVSMVVILDTAIRIGELVQTVVDDYDLVNRKVRVRATVSKTREERILPLSKVTAKLLEELIEIDLENGCETVFNSKFGTVADAGFMSRQYRRYGQRCGIKKTCTPYIFRHTAAVEMVRNNVDVFTLQKMMGHRDITTTRQYIQLNFDDIQKRHREAGVLDALLQ